MSRTKFNKKRQRQEAQNNNSRCAKIMLLQFRKQLAHDEHNKNMSCAGKETSSVNGRRCQHEGLSSLKDCESRKILNIGFVVSEMIRRRTASTTCLTETIFCDTWHICVLCPFCKRTTEQDNSVALCSVRCERSSPSQVHAPGAPRHVCRPLLQSQWAQNVKRCLTGWECQSMR